MHTDFVLISNIPILLLIVSIETFFDEIDFKKSLTNFKLLKFQSFNYLKINHVNAAA
jgi:hypothetical protein